MFESQSLWFSNDFPKEKCNILVLVNYYSSNTMGFKITLTKFNTEQY